LFFSFYNVADEIATETARTILLGVISLHVAEHSSIRRTGRSSNRIESDIRKFLNRSTHKVPNGNDSRDLASLSDSNSPRFITLHSNLLKSFSSISYRSQAAICMRCAGIDLSLDIRSDRTNSSVVRAEQKRLDKRWVDTSLDTFIYAPIHYATLVRRKTM